MTPSTSPSSCQLPQLNKVTCDICKKVVCLVDSGIDKEPLWGYRVFCSEECQIKFDNEYQRSLQ